RREIRRSRQAGSTRERAGSPGRSPGANLGVGHRRLFYRESQTNLLEHAGDRDRERPLHGASAGALMATAAGAFSHGTYVHHAFAPQSHPVAAVRRLTKERGDLHIPNRERVVDDSLAVLLL